MLSKRLIGIGIGLIAALGMSFGSAQIAFAAPSQGAELIASGGFGEQNCPWDFYDDGTFVMREGVFECDHNGSLSWGWWDGDVSWDDLMNGIVRIEVAEGETVHVQGRAMLRIRDYPSLTTVDLSNFDFSGATDLSSFLGSWQTWQLNLTTVIPPSNPDFSCLENAEGMFNNIGVTHLDLSGWNLSNATDLSRMIYHCPNLVTIDLTGTIPPASANFNGMIADNDSLTTIYSDILDDWAGCVNTGKGGIFAYDTNNDNTSILPVDMFLNMGVDGYMCNMDLVGGAGTQFTIEHFGADYAHVDSASNPGYFTAAPVTDRRLLALMERAEASFVNVSVNGTDIPANEYWTTQAEKDPLVAALAAAEAAYDAGDPSAYENVYNALSAALSQYEIDKKAGLAPSAFTVNSLSNTPPTYNAYRLFTGNVENVDGKNVMSGIALDPSVDAEDLQGFLVEYGYEGDTSAQNMAEFIANRIAADDGAVPVTTNMVSEAFDKIQAERVYPYLNSIGYNGPSDDVEAMVEWIELNGYDVTLLDTCLDYSFYYPVLVAMGYDGPEGLDEIYNWMQTENISEGSLSDYVDEGRLDIIYDIAQQFGYTGNRNMDAIESWMGDVWGGNVMYYPETPVYNAEGFPVPSSNSFALALAKWTVENVDSAATVTAGNRLQGAEGYYLLVNNTVPAGWSGTSPIWVPLGGQPVQITEKTSAPTLDKQVRENSLIPDSDGKTHGTTAVTQFGSPLPDWPQNSSVFRFNITGLNSPNAAKPVSVTTRFGAVLPLDENGNFESSIMLTENDGIACLTFDNFDGGPVSVPVETAAEPIQLEDFEMMLFDGDAIISTGVDPGTGWTITYDDGVQIEIYPDGGLSAQTTIGRMNDTGIVVTSPITEPNPVADPSWGKAADAAGYEAVQYRLTATLPMNLSSYETYSISIADALPFNATADNVRVKVINGESSASVADITDIIIASGGRAGYYEADYTNPNNPPTGIYVDIPNLNTPDFVAKGVTANSHIVVEYNAMLVDPKYGPTGTEPNVNTATMTYSSDPTNAAARQTTATATANLYTYRMILIKTDASTSQTLPSAGFTIMKDGLYVQADGSLGSSPYRFMTHTIMNNDNTPHQTITLPTAAFEIAGLDAGVYTISEVAPPDGYQQLSGDLTLTITRTLNPDGTISNLAASVTGGPLGTDVTLDTVDRGMNDLVENVIVLTVPNTKELVMPITGLSGNAVFYAIAGLLAVIAIAGYIVSRKKVAKKKARKVSERK